MEVTTMIDFTVLSDVIRVNCENRGFGPFSVLIVPEEDENTIEQEYAYYLIHKKYATVKFMFIDVANTPEEAAERAYHNAIDYIPDFITECLGKE